MMCCLCWTRAELRDDCVLIAGTTTNAEAYKQWELQKRAQVSTVHLSATFVRALYIRHMLAAQGPDK